VIEWLLTCHEAEHALSRDLDGLLDEHGRRTLRLHLLVCDECERIAWSQRAQQSAFRSLLDVQLPTALRSFDPDTHV
jgi:anti-sigma factor RsiW